MRALKQFLQKLPWYVWIIITALIIAECLFWPAIMQIDTMFWNCYWTSEKIDEPWIPQFGWTYYDSFIFFFNVIAVAFHIPILVIIWLTAKHLHLKRDEKKGELLTVHTC